jgi:hypothetical protein
LAGLREQLHERLRPGPCQTLQNAVAPGTEPVLDPLAILEWEEEPGKGGSARPPFAPDLGAKRAPKSTDPRLELRRRDPHLRDLHRRIHERESGATPRAEEVTSTGPRATVSNCTVLMCTDALRSRAVVPRARMRYRRSRAVVPAHRCTAACPARAPHTNAPAVGHVLEPGLDERDEMRETR